MVHSVAMTAAVRNPRYSRLPVVRASERTDARTAEFVRLSQLRKLRECEQVAAVCYRMRSGKIEFLLVRTRGSGRWTFPKGSAEPGLTHAEAAALEAFEEAGVHGRIEEASFARYGRRTGRGGSAQGSGRKEPAVHAHLCEVLRLSIPQESGRNRTWFSVQETRQRLREGRRSDDGAAFVRVVDKAAARIRQIHAGTDIGDPPQGDRPQPEALQKDALRKVRFDFAESYGRPEEASVMPHIRRALGRMHRFAVPVVDAQSREVLRGEVLQFEPAREKKLKALRAGASFRG
jgi:8-oxo-dGTP pyrophosphatase MutT (NUDIX family)